MKFLTPAEAKRARPNLDDSATMRVDEYAGVIAQNDFLEIHFVECQLINRFGNRCKKKRGDGWIVRRKDGVELFIGGDCFEFHLKEVGGAIAEQFERDVAKLRREIELADARKRLAEKKADAALAKHLTELWNRANDLIHLQTCERRAIGPKVLDRLAKMAKLGSRSVPGETKYIEKREDKDQKVYEVAVWRPISYGAVVNPEAMDPGPLARIAQELRAATAAQRMTVPIEEIEFRELKKLLKTFEPIEYIPQRLDALERSLLAFATPANMRTICWLARDSVDRDQVVHHGLGMSNQPRDRNQIIALITQWQREIEAQNEGRDCRPL